MGQKDGVSGTPRPASKVAVVGSGLAGLTTAFLLHQDPRRRYEVTLFESHSRIALDAASLTVKHADSFAEERIDVPMRSFAGGFYQNLIRMYDFLGVRYHQQPFIFAFAQPDSSLAAATRSTYFVHASNNHRLPPLRPRAVSLGRYLIELVWVLLAYGYWTIAIWALPPHSHESVAMYVRRIRLPQRFEEQYLLPLLASVATCSHAELLAFPASDIVGYRQRSLGAPHLSVTFGVRDVSTRLARGFHTRLSTRVVEVSTLPSGLVQVRYQDGSQTAKQSLPSVEQFHHVVLAVTPPAAGAMHAPLRPLVASIPMTKVDTIVMRDHALAQGLVRDAAESQPPLSPAQLITFYSDRGQTLAAHVTGSGVIVQTKVANAPAELCLQGAAAHVLQEVQFPRVLRSVSSRHRVNQLLASEPRDGRPPSQQNGAMEWRNGDGNVWLAGSWCWDGMVLLEGCVVSAMRVAQRLGVTVPWEQPVQP